MTKTAKQVIRLAPLLLWRSLFQAKKLYRSIYQNKRAQFIYTWAFFLGGIIFGTGLALLHYYFYRLAGQSILFALTVGVALAMAFAVAIAFGFAFAFAVAVASASSIAEPIQDPGASIFVFAVAFAGAGAAAVHFSALFIFAGTASVLAAFLGSAGAAVAGSASVSGAFTGAAQVEGTFFPSFLLLVLTALGAFLLTPTAALILLMISISCWFIIFLYGKDQIKLRQEASTFIFLTAWLLIVLAGGGSIHILRPYEMIIYPLAFLVGYLFSSSFNFLDKQQEFEKYFREPGNYDWSAGISHTRFARTQLKSLLWSPIIAILLFIPAYFDLLPLLRAKLQIAAAGFLIMPIFILHIPSYLTILLAWNLQQRKILKKMNNPEEVKLLFKRSVIFKQEFCYFQFPRLHQLLITFSQNPALGISYAVKNIHHLYWFTFQARQAEKTVKVLAQNNPLALHLYLSLLWQKSLPLLLLAAEYDPLAGYYLMLFDNDKRQWLAHEVKKLVPPRTWKKSLSHILEKEVPENMEERVKQFCQAISKHQDILFTQTLIRSLLLPVQTMQLKSLDDFCASFIFNDFHIPPSIANTNEFFSFIPHIVTPIETIRRLLSRPNNIESMEKQPALLKELNQRFKELHRQAEDTLVEPFCSMWHTMINHLEQLVAG